MPDGAFLREACWHSAGLAFLPPAKPTLTCEWRLRARKHPAEALPLRPEYRRYTEEACGGGHGNRKGSHQYEPWMKRFCARENELDRSARPENSYTLSGNNTLH